MEEFLESGSHVAVVLALLGGALGLPLPEEVILLTAGALAGQGVTRWWVGLPVCYGGVLLADCLLYFVARKLGNAALSHRPFRRVLPPERREKLRRLFDERGPWVILVARHVPGLRAATFVLAGIDRYPIVRFLLWDGLGVLFSVTIVFGLGYLFSGKLDWIRQRLAEVQELLLVAVALLLLFFVARALWRHRLKFRFGRH